MVLISFNSVRFARKIIFGNEFVHSGMRHRGGISFRSRVGESYVSQSPEDPMVRSEQMPTNNFDSLCEDKRKPTNLLDFFDSFLTTCFFRAARAESSSHEPLN